MAPPLPSRLASELRLGFITQASAARDGVGYVTTTGVGRLVEALAARVGCLTVGISVAAAPLAIHDHRLTLDASRLRPYGFVPSMARAFLMTRELRRAVAAVERESDVVVVQLPWAPPHALVLAQRPRVYHVCADVRGVVGASKFYRGVRGSAARAAAWLVDDGQRRLMHRRGVRVVTNGEALWIRSGRPQGRPVVSSVLRVAEVGSVRRRRPPGAPLRLLFVGFLRPEKGVDTLLDAYDRILLEDPTVELRIVGSQDLSEGGTAREIADRVTGPGRRGNVELVGHVAFGPTLFAEYADADILVVPSRSEGTPRVLLEARAFGCLTVATSVGGIPSSITDGVDGVLVLPDDPASLARAILELARDPRRRASLVASGLARAYRTTVDDYAGEILAEAMLAVGS